MNEDIVQLQMDQIADLQGCEYSLYVQVLRAVGTPSEVEFYSWWYLIPRSYLHKIRRLWRYRSNARGRSAYVMYCDIAQHGAVSRSDFYSWWNILPPDVQQRLLLRWYTYLRCDCASVRVV